MNQKSYTFKSFIFGHLTVSDYNFINAGHLCHEAIEILVAYEYLNPSTLQPPTSAMLGFYHALVRLCTHDWESDPLILDLSVNEEGESVELNRADRLAIVEQFRALRSAASSSSNSTSLPSSLNASMYIVTSCDKLLELNPSLLAKR